MKASTGGAEGHRSGPASAETHTMPAEPSVETLVLEETAEFPASPVGKVPFPCHLSLEPLLEWWAREAEEDAHGLAEHARALLGRVEESPELRGDLADDRVLEGQRGLVDALMSVLMPPALTRMGCAAVQAPFGERYLGATPRFRRTFLDEGGRLAGRAVMHGRIDFDHLLAIFANLMVLRVEYGIEIPFHHSQLYEVVEPATGLLTWYQLRVHLEYLRIRVRGERPALDPDALAALHDEVTDLAAWRRLLPPERFALVGLLVHEFTEVTTEVALSRLKGLLMRREALRNGDCFREVEESVQILLRRPEVRLLVALVSGGDAWFLHPTAIEAPLENRTPCLQASELERFVPGTLRQDGQMFGLCEAGHGCQAGGFQSALTALGLCRAFLAPLNHEGELVGYVSLASDQEDSLTAFEILSLAEVFPLFALAVRNSAEVLRERVQSAMKEHFTAIHPSVEWRFREAAQGFLRTEHIEPIVFPGVYPLYGVSDIRNSSQIRLQSIQADLVTQLGLAREFLQACLHREPLPYLEHLIHTVDRALAELEAHGLGSGQETWLMEFLRREVEGLFGTFEGEEVARTTARYRAALDPELGFVYQRRFDFEDSVGKIRELLGDLLLEEQERAQGIFPHYFELHKTDGVDHMMYAGASLAERPGFADVHLRSLRIWQIQAMCRLAREAERLRPTLQIPLGTAHLILVQETPLAIRFMMDDRRFDVDGAYNARYEIVKKRLDKAEVRGTGERLTQPGHLAVVYSNPRESSEYREYLQFLAESGEVVPEIEDHELSELQGVQGLRALRVRVT